MQTRREFLTTSAMCVLILGMEDSQSCLSASEQDRQDCLSSTVLVGDPYTAHADEPGLGGRSFDAARDHALRFRTPDAYRDRFALGLEI
jgi:hypothetical protein